MAIINTDPMWLSFLKSNPEAASSYFEWITLMQEQVKDRIMEAVEKDDNLEAKLLRGELRALDKLRNLSTIADRQKQAEAEHQHIKNSMTNINTRSLRG